jgi:hypothetical protein
MAEVVSHRHRRQVSAPPRDGRLFGSAVSVMAMTPKAQKLTQCLSRASTCHLSACVPGVPGIS